MNGKWYDCVRCGVGIWITDAQYTTLFRTRQGFYCLYGHGQHFNGKRSTLDELEEVRRERDRLKQNAAHLMDCVATEKRAAIKSAHCARAFKGIATRIKKRVGAGVCPCCNRRFSQLAAHMATKHPSYAAEPVTDPAT